MKRPRSPAESASATQGEAELKGKQKEEIEDGPLAPPPKRRANTNSDEICPYLDTINRALLDFDFEKVCSVSSININVYCCLVCGRYFQGRSRNSHAYFHSLASGHHVFINLHNEKVYCLPDSYEVKDSSLEDIKFVLHPRFTPEQVAQLDSQTTYSTALDGTQYLPGFVGLNNIKHNDYINAIVQCLVHVPPFRDFFMIEENYKNCKSHLVQTFGELVRKMWNPRNFKGHVSPHELLQAITLASNKRFMIGKQSDPLDFLTWFLHTLHKDLGGTRKHNSSIVHRVFQGFVHVTTLSEPASKADEKDNTEEGEGEGSSSSASSMDTDRKGREENENMKDEENGEESGEPSTVTEADSPFLLLSMDIPPPPLFKDEQEKSVIPQVPLFTCLAKYDGHTETWDTVRRQRRKYTIKKLPRYIILHLKRFTKNNWFVEKNPTIVNFPVKNLEMKEYTMPPASNSPTKYNLVANLCHDGQYDKGSYRAHVLNRATDQWLEMEDLIVKETLPQLVSLSEAYIQIYELKDAPPMK